MNSACIPAGIAFLWLVMWNRPWLHRTLIAGLFFGVIAPTLPWLDFTRSMEETNVATALETVRDGHWIIPSLYLAPRLAKPPIVHWITALGILSSPGNIGWGARWPSLIMACLALVAIYELGRILVDTPTGLIAACVGGTNLLFLKYARQASYDLHLTTWVLWTNVFLAGAITTRRRAALPAAGLCLGLAIMCKGPVAILQSVIPLGIFLAVEKRPRPAGSILLATAICLAVVLPWPAYVIGHIFGWNPVAAIRFWYHEIARDHDPDPHRPKIYTYLVLTLLMTPWIIWFFAGIADVAINWKQTLPGLRLAFLWLMIPVAVLAFFPQRDRYLLPMIGPAAILAAYGITRLVATHQPRLAWLKVLHYATLAGMVCAFPLAEAYSAGWPFPRRMKLLTTDAQPWLSSAAAIATAAAGAALLAATIALSRRRWTAFVGGTTALALLFTLIYNWGYRRAEGDAGVGPAAAAMLAPYPDAEIFNARADLRPYPPDLLLIYLNRDVRPIADPAALPPSDHPQVLIYPPEDTHSPPPPGFVPLGQSRLDNGVYRIFVRTPAQGGV
jgi:4-amino-4-deoxy-L-arabinose transferase-like glycosyltransferase